jgi:hypothetical protein
VISTPIQKRLALGNVVTAPCRRSDHHVFGRSVRAVFPAACPEELQWTHSRRRRHQLTAHHVQVRKYKQRPQLRRVLRQAPIAHLGKPELPLHYSERMLDSGSQLGQRWLISCFHAGSSAPLSQRFRSDRSGSEAVRHSASAAASGQKRTIRIFNSNGRVRP